MTSPCPQCLSRCRTGCSGTCPQCLNGIVLMRDGPYNPNFALIAILKKGGKVWFCRSCCKIYVITEKELTSYSVQWMNRGLLYGREKEEKTEM